MRISVACALLLAACGSVSVSNNTGDGGGGGRDGGNDGGGDPSLDVQVGLIGRWAVLIDGTQECTADVTAEGIDVDCGTSITMVTPTCTQTLSSHLVGTWHDVLQAVAEDRYSYTGTCDMTYVNRIETAIEMSADRIMTSTATGVWQESAGTWHYLATDPMNDTDFIECTGVFTPSAATNMIDIDCNTAWQARTDLPNCQERGNLHLDGTFHEELMLQYTGETERQGACGSLPLLEPGDAAINVRATPI